MKRLFLALMLIVGLGTLAYAAQAKFAIDKKLCLGNPASLSDPSLCQEPDPAAQNAPVYYMFTLTNPWSQPQQTIALSDQLPSQFTPAVGGLFCKADDGSAVSWTPNTATNGLAIVPLQPGQTVYCFLAGTFSSAGKPKNTVKGKNQDGYSNQSDVTTDVTGAPALPVNLKLNKTVSPATIDLSSGAQVVTYTITITNTDPVTDAVIGNWFELHDVMSLLPGSVPLNAVFVQASCTPGPNSDCLDPAGPQFASGSTLFVGTMNQTAFFDWGFANNSDTIAHGETITLTIEVKIFAAQGLDCVRSASSNGLANKAWFTLTDSNGTALADTNLTDNTSTANLGATFPGATVDPDCGLGQLKVSKKEINPNTGTLIPASTIHAWGAPVTYRITIENASLPAQQITINKHDLQDWVTEGVNTPPFTRNHVSTGCVTSASSPGLCSNFTPAGTNINTAPPFSYSYYGETNQGWDSNDKIVLQPGEKIVFDTTFTYDKPDCETVPATPKRPIINTVRLSYKAIPFGAPTSAAAVQITQSADAVTLMKEQPPCKFRVTKVLTSGGPQLQFGAPLKYTVTFINLGAPRKIGTLFDAVRITIPGYASALPYTSTWLCTAAGGIAGPFVPSGSVSAGTATYVGSGAQGSQAAIANIGHNLYFPTGASITCQIKITVQRPPLGDPYCTTSDAYFENVAMMDVTNPFNTNITWPPSSGWNPTSMTNPVPQNRNWASVRTLLPKCWDAHVNKTASVGGLPAGSAPWTYPGNPNPVNYTISVTNDADSPLGTGSPIPGWIVQDKFAPPYTSGTQQFTGCNPATWCWTVPPHNPKGQVGIRNLNPGQTGTWSVNQPGGAYPVNPVLAGTDLTNCAWILPQNAQAGSGWYNNQLAVIPPVNCPSSSSAACPSGNNPLVACVTVPVLQVTKISVRKRVIDQTGANVMAASGYGIQVSCSPYAIPTSAGASFYLATNSTGYSPFHSVSPVPMSGTCTVTEPGAPIPAAISQKCGGVGNVIATTSITPLPAVLNSVDNQVTVTNTYACAGSPTLVVGKKFLNPEVPNGGGSFPPMNFPVSVNCTPGGIQTQSIATTGNTVSSVSFAATLGAVCQVLENPAAIAFPQAAIDFCAAMSPSQVPVWKTPVYNPQNGTPPGTSITIGSGTNQVLIKNEWKCATPLPANGQLEVIKELNTIAHPIQFPATTWAIDTNCNPSGSASQLSLTTAASGNAQITASGMVTAPVGANCAVSEQTPATSLIPAWFQSYCALPAQGSGTAVWNVPEYSVNNGPYSTTAPSVSITAGVTTVRVKNGWHCVPSATPTVNYQFQVFKRVAGPTVQVPAMTFQIVSNCSSPASPAALSVTTNPPHNSFAGAGAFTVPSGSTCNLSEVLPDPKLIPAMVAYCSAQAPNIEPKWLAPTWSTSATGTPALNLPITANASQNLFITNTWICGTPATGKVKPKGKPKIRINIGIGSILGGGGKPKDQPQPGDNGPPRP
ncbi:MAG: DUF5979 domain-containing protein [Novosphingobium sp.]|uniref:DUF5979 domain-containing protein n=1 Tax=Novosphingobium sp. TaxID=1874826 RepID=UPI003C7C66A6